VSPPADPRCRSCGSSALTRVVSLGDLPLADGLLSADRLDESEARYPLDVALCSDCALVQLLHTVPREELFCADYPYYSSFSDSFVEHARRSVEARIEARKLGPGNLVVELASNDGYLLQHYRARGVPVLGIDPAEGPARAATDRGIPTIQSFFDRELALRLRAEGRSADVIHANNVLAHVPDPNGFVAGMALLLRPGGEVVIEVPYVRDLIEGCEFDTIYHEHLCYFSVTALRALLARHGLRLGRVDPLPVHGGSLRAFATREGPEGEAVGRWLDAEARAGRDRPPSLERVAERVEGIRTELRSLLGGLRAQGKRVAAYGAAAKGVILLNYTGIGRELVDFVVDRNVHKQGRFLPGVRIPIRPPEALLDERPDYTLLLPWNLRDEILAQQEPYRRAGGRFIVPIPRPEII
jgi:SAM-dependent methyltransferase